MLLDSSSTSAAIEYDGNNNIRLIGGDTLDVEGSGNFGLYYLDISVSNGFFPGFTASDQGNNQWLFLAPEGQDPGGPVFGSDMAPVPIPTSLILFGCGLVGLVGISRKHRK
jgi:hypothetical protein